MPLQALDDISCSLRAIGLVPAEEQVKIDWMAGCYMMIRLTLKLTDNLLTVFKSCTDENISFAGDFLHKGLARLVYNFKLGVDSSYDPGGLFSEDKIMDKATWLRSFPTKPSAWRRLSIEGPQYNHARAQFLQERQPELWVIDMSSLI